MPVENPNPESITDNHQFHQYGEGDSPWTHSQDMAHIEQRLPIRDVEANVTNYVPHAGATFVATDSGAVYDADGSEWSKATREYETVTATQFVGGLDADGNDITNVGAFDAENAGIKDRNGISVDASQFDGADMSVKVNNAFDYLKSTYDGGTVTVPQPESAPHAQTEKMDIPVPTTNGTSFVLKGEGGVVEFEPVSGFSPDIGLEFLPNSSGSLLHMNGVDNIAINDANGELSRVVRMNDGVQYWMQNIYLYSPSALDLLELIDVNNTPQHNWFSNLRLTSGTGSGRKIRLGNSGNAPAINNYFFGAQLDSPVNTSTAIEVYGHGNQMWGIEIGAADIGIDIQGNNNQIYPRFEQAGSRFNTPIRFGDGSERNIVRPVHGGAKRYSQLGGFQNRILETIYTAMDDFKVRGSVPPHFNQDVSGSGSISTSFQNLRLSTGSTDGSHAQLDYDGNAIVNSSNHPVLTLGSVNPRDTANVHISIGLYRDSNNMIRFYYDDSAPNSVSGSNWVAETIDGGTATRDNTGDSPGADDQLRIQISGDSALYFVDGSLVAEHQSIDLPNLEPRFRLENSAAENKEFDIRYGGLLEAAVDI